MSLREGAVVTITAGLCFIGWRLDPRHAFEVSESRGISEPDLDILGNQQVNAHRRIRGKEDDMRNHTEQIRKAIEGNNTEVEWESKDDRRSLSGISTLKATGNLNARCYESSIREQSLMWEKIIEILVKRYPLAVIIIGVFLLLIGAVGMVPFGNPPLLISGIGWQITLAAIGVVLVLSGLWLLRRESLEIPGTRWRKTKYAKLDRRYPEDPRLSLIVPPLNQGQYATIKFPVAKVPAVFNWLYTPLGITLVYDVPFFMEPVFDSSMQYRGHRTIDIHPHHGNKANVEEVPADVSSVSIVYFLLSAGHGKVEHEGVPFLHKRIGYIELQFAAEDIQREDLILGKNVREWAPGNPGNLVRSLDFSLARPAWVSHNQRYRVDMLSIHVKDGPKDLSSIQVVAKFEDDPPKPMSLPSIIVSSITCKRG